jgi:hypothetical protein
MNRVVSESFLAGERPGRNLIGPTLQSFLFVIPVEAGIQIVNERDARRSLSST